MIQFLDIESIQGKEAIRSPVASPIEVEIPLTVITVTDESMRLVIVGIARIVHRTLCLQFAQAECLPIAKAVMNLLHTTQRLAVIEIANQCRKRIDRGCSTSSARVVHLCGAPEVVHKRSDGVLLLRRGRRGIGVQHLVPRVGMGRKVQRLLTLFELYYPSSSLWPSIVTHDLRDSRSHAPC